MKKSACLVLILALIAGNACRAQDTSHARCEFSLYSIGNSHTWDFRPAGDFREITEAMDIHLKNGWHINCGKNLQTIWSSPDETCVALTVYGTYQHAIGEHVWDAITLQTFTGGTGKLEKEALEDFLGFISGSINRDAEVFVYCTWPKNTATPLGAFNYTDAWLSDFRENDTLKVLSEAYFGYLEASFENAARHIQWIPLGRVLYHFDRQARSGGVPGFSGAGQLYRDAWHLNNVGRYIAGLTVFSQIFRIDPLDIPVIDAYHTADQWPCDRDLTEEQKTVIRGIISKALDF
jgi:hypothetical protein